MKTSTGKSTMIITVFALISAVLGFGRDAYIAYKYGASGVTDEFYVAAVVPDMVAQVIAFALTYAFIPVLQAELRKSHRSAIRLTSAVFWLSAFSLLLITTLTVLLRGPLIHLLAPGFSPEQLRETSNLLLIMSASVIFCGLAGVLSGIHNAREQFSFPALTGIVNNLLLVVTAVVLGPWLGIEGLAFAFSMGYFGRFIVQIVPLLRSGQLQLSIYVWHRSIMKIIRSIGPIVFNSGFQTITVIVDRILASHLPPGQITILNYASKLGMLPYTMIGTSLATTLYVRFVTHTMDDNKDGLRRLSSLGTGWAVFWALVIGAGLVLYGRNLMAVLFGHGDFSSQDVNAAVLPLRYFGYGAICYLLPPILSRFFYARQENWFVTFASFASLCIDVGMSILLVHPFGISGLVLANALSQFIMIVILGAMLVRRLNWAIWVYARRAISIGLVPGLVFLFGSLIVKVFWLYPPSISHWMELWQGVVAVLTAVLLVAGYAKVWTSNEIAQVVDRTRKSLFSRLHLTRRLKEVG